MIHNHCECQHQLQYCSICDVVYCIKCHREWRSYYYSSYIYGEITPVNPWSATIKCDCTHSH